MPTNYLEPEFAAPYTAWKTDPSPTNADALLSAVHPVLTSALRTYGHPSPTLRSRAKVIALDAMGRYDPTQAKLRTHLLMQLQGLRRHAARELQILPLPEQVGLDLSRTQKAEDELRDQLGRDPSTAELADHTGLSLKRLAYIRQSKPGVLASTLSAGSGAEDRYDPGIQEAQSHAANWQEFVYHDLGPTDQLIMEHSLGLHGQPVLNNNAIAAKLSVSPGAISQRKAKIQGMLDMQEDLGPL
jgi:DNA-directed RNA polymerase specialized sigma subunit